MLIIFEPQPNLKFYSAVPNVYDNWNAVNFEATDAFYKIVPKLRIDAWYQCGLLQNAQHSDLQ